MPLNDLEFRLDEDGVGVVLNAGLNGPDDLPVVDVFRVRGLDSAPPRDTERDWEGNDGGFMDARYERGRPITLEGTAYADVSAMETYLDSLKENWAVRTDLTRFYFKVPDRVSDRFLLVKPLGCRYDWNTLRRTGTAEIQFNAFAEDPRIYETPEQSALIVQGATVFTGFGFDFGFDFGFGGTSSVTDGVTVTNVGNRPTPAIFEMEGPVLNPRILNDTTGDELVFIIDVLAGETLVVDTKYKTVRLNGVNRRNALQGPNWFHMQKGDNFIRYRAESGSNSELLIRWYPAWR